MNSYQVHIDAYKEVLNSGRTDIDRDLIKAEIKSLEPFAERTEKERLQMFDSGAFNDVTCSYCKVAMKNCGVADEKINEVCNELYHLFDMVGANEIIKRS